ncbi:cobyric acid synthase [Pararhizobium mangrovi]|uniref:Cobyric acid synthase n=1 Tax=Pararhizobium mangrovi TaxID=2590452 RepID=A0A506UFV6_9HYPH|nr:cobyric acid synthase [Pararhizobium mangrovi]TPW31945.1 cobyric acid synthase [Pararhizobium mangrovi]
MAKALMLQGTGSDVGKTVLVAGLCRLFANRGIAVRPFKPQNMSNNAAVAEDGGEIGRGQWLQALACRVPSSIHMNPVLLKPEGEAGSQVVVQGMVRGRALGRDYATFRSHLLDAVLESYRRVAADADLVLVEGAGSPAEINLRDNDIANMGFATRADVPVVLVGDIDRGGVIASLVGTSTILAEADQRMIAGYIVNKFRGDASLFDEGLAAIGRFTDWPCFGVVPWIEATARLPAEDSVALDRMARPGGGTVKIAVPRLPRIANFDDLDPIRAEPDVELVFVAPGERLPADAALVVIPGSKATIADLAALRANGWDRDLAVHHEGGGHVVGICGGYQMLGRRLADPMGIEGAPNEVEGLGLLDVETVMVPEKHVRNVTARTADGDLPLEGYEIHVGETTGPGCARPSVTIDGRPDGAVSPDGRVFGTYLHGLFGADAFRRSFLGKLGATAGARGHREGVEAALDALAEALETHLDIDGLLAVSRTGNGG